ncbi:MAG: UbiA-like polyprenyltransferase [Bacteroidales bacterium]
MTTIKSYFSLIKFSHTIFALPFAAIGFFVAVSEPAHSYSNSLLVYVVLCMIFARSAAMAFNRYIDADIDIKNNRTATREIPSGIIRPRAALTFTVIACILFITTTYFINHLCFYLSPVALFVILSYSYTKRFTALCHFILGLGLSLAPIGAYIAVTGEFALVPILFSCIVLTWTGGFDIIYALQDEEFDSNEGLYSIPAQIGRKKAIQLSIIVHSITALLVILTGIMGNFNYVYWIGSGLFTGLLVFQHTVVTPDDISKVNIAFGTSNGIASVLFAISVIVGFYV